MNFETLRNKVIERVSLVAYTSMLRFVNRHPPVLWGLEREGNFLEAALCYTLYIDLKRCGIVKFVGKVGQRLGFKLTPRSVLHNVNKIRATLADWATEQILLGDQDAWDRAAANVTRPGKLKVSPCREVPEGDNVATF